MENIGTTHDAADDFDHPNLAEGHLVAPPRSLPAAEPEAHLLSLEINDAVILSERGPQAYLSLGVVSRRICGSSSMDIRFTKLIKTARIQHLIHHQRAFHRGFYPMHPHQSDAPCKIAVTMAATLAIFRRIHRRRPSFVTRRDRMSQKRLPADSRQQRPSEFQHLALPGQQHKVLFKALSNP